MHQDVAQQINSGDDAADLNDKHDRVLHHRARTQFDQRIDQCTTYDFVSQRERLRVFAICCLLFLFG